MNPLHYTPNKQLTSQILFENLDVQMEVDEYVPDGKQCDDNSEPMDIPVPDVGNSKYFTFAPVRKHQHPTNPLTNGLISSRILPDGSNTIRFTTALAQDIEIPDKPDFSAYVRMNSEDYQKDYSLVGEKPTILSHGEISLNWVE